MNRAYALLASLILIATPMAGCLSGEDIEELVDDVLGCMDENAANYDENATAELVGDCLYMASIDAFISAMEDMQEMSIDDMLEEDTRAGYSSIISVTTVSDEMGGGPMDISIEEHVMVDLENDSAMVRTYLSVVPMVSIDYQVIQVGQVINIHIQSGTMMSESISVNSQTRDAEGSVMDMVHSMISGSPATSFDDMSSMGDDDNDMDETDDIPTDSASFSYDSTEGTQTMSMSIVEDGNLTEMTIVIDENENLISYMIHGGDGVNETTMEFTVMWGDAIVIEIDESLPRTAIPVWLEGISGELGQDHGSDDDDDDGDEGPPSPQEVLDWFDSNGDDYLSWDEFWNMWGDGEGEEAQDDLMGIFEEADTDMDEQLSLDELEYFIEMVDDYESDDGITVESVLEMMDSDGDGMLTWEEFDNFIQYQDGGYDSEEERTDFQNTFNSADENDDDYLDYGEIELFISMVFEDDDGDDDYAFYCSNDGEDYAESMGGILCPEGPGVTPECPNGESCVCIDVDGSCDDGDDDWGYYADDDDEEMFVCDNGEEIPMDWVDDGYEDCEDGSDENTQTNENMQNSNEFSVSAYLTDNWASSDQEYVDPEFTIDSGFDDVDNVDFELMDSEGWSLMTLTIQPSDFIETIDGNMLYYVSLDGLMLDQGCYTLMATVTTNDGNSDTWTRDDICIYEDSNNDDDDDGNSGPMHGVVADNLTFFAPISDFELRFLNCNGVDSLEACSLVFSGSLDSGVASVPEDVDCNSGCEATFTFDDVDMNGMVSPGDTLTIDDNSGGFTVALWDTWAQEYTDDSSASMPTLPGFGALLGTLGLLGAALASRRE